MSVAASDGDSDAVEMTAARLPKEIVRQANVVAQRRGTTIGELLGGMVRTPLLREYRKVIDEMHRELGENGAG